MRKTKQIALESQKRTLKTRVARVSNASKLQQDLIDERVIAEADDPSAWGPPVDVKRRGRSVALSASLARRASFLARLHREQNLDTWLERIVRERVELEERAFNDARRRMGAKRPV